MTEFMKNSAVALRTNKLRAAKLAAIIMQPICCAFNRTRTEAVTSNGPLFTCSTNSLTACHIASPAGGASAAERRGRLAPDRAGRYRRHAAVAAGRDRRHAAVAALRHRRHATVAAVGERRAARCAAGCLRLFRTTEWSCPTE